MRPTRRYLVLATTLLALVALAVAAEPPETVAESEAPTLLVSLQTPQGTAKLEVPREHLTPELWQQINDRRVEPPRTLGVAPGVPPTPCSAQTATAQTAIRPGSSDPCALGAEIASMTPCPAADPAECAAYRAWSERFGAPEALPAPVELPIERSASDRP